MPGPIGYLNSKFHPPPPQKKCMNFFGLNIHDLHIYIYFLTYLFTPPAHAFLFPQQEATAKYIYYHPLSKKEGERRAVYKTAVYGTYM
jgi:hypothetical protein